MELSDFERLLKCARKGETEAQYLVGLSYLEPLPFMHQPAMNVTAKELLKLIGTFDEGAPPPAIQPDATEAYTWLLRAAEKNHPRAQNKLGDLFYYHNGDGSGPDTIRAVKWYKKAAANGLAEGQYNFGRCLVEGEGILQNKKMGGDLLMLAARQNYAPAYTFLADILADGIHVPVDVATAFGFYQKALTLGDRSAAPKLVALMNAGTCAMDRSETGIGFPDGSFVPFAKPRKRIKAIALPPGPSPAG